MAASNRNYYKLISNGLQVYYTERDYPVETIKGATA